MTTTVFETAEDFDALEKQLKAAAASATKVAGFTAPGLRQAASDANIAATRLRVMEIAREARLGQLHVWVAEARSAKIGFAEYISAKMEEAWKIEAR